MTGIVEAGLICLALNVHYEAGAEPVEGQMAVAHVTLNRAGGKISRVCDVVFERAQFSWTGADGKQHAPMSEKVLARAMKLARTAWKDHKAGNDISGGAWYYHTANLKKVKWSKGLTPIMQIGQHVFFTREQVASR